MVRSRRRESRLAWRESLRESLLGGTAAWRGLFGARLGLFGALVVVLLITLSLLSQAFLWNLIAMTLARA